MDWLKEHWFRIGILVLATLVIFLSLRLLNSQSISSEQDDFSKKQECVKYGELVKTRVEDSGRLFEKDTYTIFEIFYSPVLDTCLYAWRINTTFDPEEIYSIDDALSGGGVFTTSLADPFWKEVERLKGL